jgi:hypothetical protein
MDDDLTTLERVLREHAAEIPHVQAVPSTLQSRARRRIVRNGLSSVVAAGLVVAAATGAFAGLGALRGASVTPHGGGSPSSPAPSSSSCIAANLRATASLDGAAGSVVGSIELTNTGADTCTLEGRPVLTLFSSPSQEVPVQVVEVRAQWQENASSQPPGWPVVSVRPGGAAAIRVRWTNACPQLTAPALWTVDLGSGKGTLDVAGADAFPSCNGAAEPSTLEVGPFEPGAGG